jgi:hypothetical protein
VLTAGPERAAAEAMGRHRAVARLDPGNPTAKGFRLRQRGQPFSEVALHSAWWARSLASL